MSTKKKQKNTKKGNLKINKKNATAKLASKNKKIVKKDSTKSIKKKPKEKKLITKNTKILKNKSSVKSTPKKSKPIKKEKHANAKSKNKTDNKKTKVKNKITKPVKESKPVKSKEITTVSQPKHKSKTTVSKASEKGVFKAGDYAVYPPHGVGKINAIDKMMILGQEIKCYVIHFEKEKLDIRIPINQAEKSGLRNLASKSEVDKVFSILRSGVKKLKGMWSRRAQEYETKINSGDIILLAEVLRDLARDIEDGERSYSERIIYETAIYRLAMEYSVVYMVDFEDAKKKVIATAKDKIGSFDQKDNEKDFDEFKDDEDLDQEEESEDDEDSDDEDDLEEDDEDLEDYDDEDEEDDDDF